MPWPHWLLTLSDVKRLVDDGRDELDRLDDLATLDDDDDDDDPRAIFDDGSVLNVSSGNIDDPEDDNDPDDELYRRLLKDHTRIDFTQTPGVSAYITDNCYQLYIKEDLFLDYTGPDAREFAASIVAFHQHKKHRNEDYYCVCYDSGFTSTSLTKDKPPNPLRLSRRECRTGEPLPPLVLLRRTANIPNEAFYEGCTHAPDTSAALELLAWIAEAYIAEMSPHHVNRSGKVKQIRDAIKALKG